ncbi:hypothetical protein IAT38_007702 [Cryptococcus sp. DSM 104549]
MTSYYDDTDSEGTARRALDATELKIAWREQPHNPGARTELEVPSTYTMARLNYELTAPGDVLVQQKLRLFQKQYLDYVFEHTGDDSYFFTNLDDDHYSSDDDLGAEEGFKGLKGFLEGEDSCARLDRIADRYDDLEAHRDVVLESLPEKLDKSFEYGSLGDNYDLAEEERMRTRAVPEWAKAWGGLRPFYPEALALNDPNRTKLGFLYLRDSVVPPCESGVSGRCTVSRKKEHIRQRVAAYRCAWAAWDNREYAPASTVRDVSAIAAKLLLSVYRGREHSNANRKALWTYFDKQATVPRDVPEKKMFKTLAPELRIALPARETLDAFGPAGWNTFFERSDAESRPGSKGGVSASGFLKLGSILIPM